MEAPLLRDRIAKVRGKLVHLDLEKERWKAYLDQYLDMCKHESTITHSGVTACTVCGKILNWD